MAGFNLYIGNLQEDLVYKLAEQMKIPASGQHVLQQEWVLLYNYGMQRWVSLEIARLNGINANTRFLFPNEFIEEVFDQVFPDRKKTGKLSHDQLFWKLHEVLQENSLPEKINQYLDQTKPLKTYYFAKKVIDLFDQYGMYRPDWLYQWKERSKVNTTQKDEQWQMELWNQLPESLRLNHPAFLRRDLLARDLSECNFSSSFPQKISVFGISSLPLFYLEILTHLSTKIEIDLYLLSPTPHFWADLVKEKDLLKNSDFLNQDKSDLHYETGNPLLSSLGTQGQDFIRMLLNFNLMDVLKEESYQNPNSNTLLGRLQSDLFELHSMRLNQMDTLPPAQFRYDSSLQFHSCHSQMREVEVLQDQILALLEKDSSLQPGDFLVMTPDIEGYAPFIKGVFSRSLQGKGTLPFSIADRNLEKESLIIQHFLKLLNLPSERFSLSSILDLIESDSIRKCFHLEEEDIFSLKEWLKDSNIRWALDGKSKKDWNLPESNENSWQFGIDRILTGYCLPSEESFLYDGILPFDHLEGNNTLIFGRFLNFFENLQKLLTEGSESLIIPRTLKEWSKFFHKILDLFFKETDRSGLEFNLLRNAFEQLGKLSNIQEIPLNGKVDLETIRLDLSLKLEKSNQQKGFLGSGITFCSMKPMRSIPFQVIALLGMQDQAFPRIDQKVSFDLMKGEKRIGDRSFREEDRYLFLEILLSARKTIYISYIGQNIQDNTKIAPSTVVNELFFYMDRRFQLESGGFKKQVLTLHPLQAFSPKYFQNSRSGIISYSEDNFRAACQLGKEKQKKTGFDLKVRKPEESFYQLDHKKLLNFFLNPSRSLLKQELNIHLEPINPLNNEEEPFALSYLDQYEIQSHLIQKIIHGESPDELLAIYRGKGILPIGIQGEIQYRKIESVAVEFANHIKSKITPELESIVPYQFSLGKYQCKGQVNSIYPEGYFQFRPTSIKAKDRLKAWFEQLFLSCDEKNNFSGQTTIYGYEHRKKGLEKLTSTRITNPLKVLEVLLGIYEMGLISPLPFFPKASFIYAEEVLNKHGNPNCEFMALKKAEKIFFGDSFIQGEINLDPYVNHCFKHLSKLENTTFMEIAIKIFTPILQHQIPNID